MLFINSIYCLRAYNWKSHFGNRNFPNAVTMADVPLRKNKSNDKSKNNVALLDGDSIWKYKMSMTLISIHSSC